VLKNCEDSISKSTGYALRNAWARISGSILRNVDVFIVQTEFQKQKFIKAGIPECRIGIVPALVPSEGCADSSTCGDLISFVGRVSHEKGINDFVDAARLLPDIPFAVAGSDSGMPGIRERSPANVRWLGFVGSNELRQLYLRSRIVVVPSRWYEGFPNVAVQAMTYGRPVVAADIGAMSCIVRDGETGLLVRVGDSRDLAEKLSALYRDRELCRRLGETGRERALAQYSATSVYAALTATYTKAILHNQRNNHGTKSLRVAPESVS
jgi:glycosyltransferase involved in cell wall biosynthesis